MRSTKKSSTRSPRSDSVSPRSTRTSHSTDQPSRPAAPARRTPPANAFSALYLSKTLNREEPPFAQQAVAAGSWEVEAVPAGSGLLYAVVRNGESVAGGDQAMAVFLRRPSALLCAAALSALATPNRLTLKRTPVRRSPKKARLGYPLHDGGIHLGHLARPDEELLPYLHAVACLAANPEAMALALESLGPEVSPILGRALMRRLEGRE